MQINDLLNNYNNQTMQTSQTTGKAEVAQTVNRMVSSLMDLPAGSVFEGSINSVKNGVVTLGLSNGGSLQAKLDNGITLNQGDTYFFEVKSNSQGQIAIRPYEGNVLSNPVLSNALEMAGLQINGKNLTMVHTMMDNAMSIDKNSLLQMSQILSDVPDTAVTSAVTMEKLGIPVNDVNLHEFINYSTDKHEITTQLNDLVKGLPLAIESGQMNVDEMVNLTKVFFEGDENANMPAASEVASTGNPDGQVMQETALSGEEVILDNSALAGKEVTLENAVLFDKEVVLENTDLTGKEMMTENAVLPGESVLTNKALNSDEAALQNGVVLEGEKDNSIPEKAIYSEAGTKSDGIEKEFPELMKQLTQLTGKQFDGGLDIQGLKNEIAELLNNSEVSKKDIAKLLTGKDFQKLFSRILDKDWALKPDEVRDKDKVRNLYDKLDKQLEQVDKLLKTMNPETVKNLSESVTKVRDNIQFMNDVNNAYTFVQIPLKMSGKNVNSDLYVMTNKKNLMDKDKEITAYLHLDMEHLGSTDVFIKMYQKKVTTNFFLEDDKSFDLIEKNLPILEKKLENLGYTVTLNLKNEKKEIDFVEDFLKKDSGMEAPKVHRYSFDVRA